MNTIKTVVQGLVLSITLVVLIYAFLIIFTAQVEQIRENEEWREPKIEKVLPFEIRCVEELSTKNYKWLRGGIDVNNTRGSQSCVSTGN